MTLEENQKKFMETMVEEKEEKVIMLYSQK